MSPQILDPVLLRTDYSELELHASGKVRDVYNLDSDHLLFVATDRISALITFWRPAFPTRAGC
jgi:phosphoribosylaminoimidazole-succinocarboxamide synthase